MRVLPTLTHNLDFLLFLIKNGNYNFCKTYFTTTHLRLIPFCKYWKFRYFTVCNYTFVGYFNMDFSNASHFCTPSFAILVVYVNSGWIRFHSHTSPLGIILLLIQFSYPPLPTFMPAPLYLHSQILITMGGISRQTVISWHKNPVPIPGNSGITCTHISTLPACSREYHSN